MYQNDSSTEYERLLSHLDTCLPDTKIISIVRKLLNEDAADGFAKVFLTEDECTLIPVDVDIAMVTKALFKEYDPSFSFGDFKVMVGLGKLTGANGWIEASYCFVTLYLNTEMELISSDWHKDWD